MENTVTNILPHTSRTIYTTCTPRARERTRFSLGVTSEPADDNHDPIDILSELLSQTWNIYGLSTLFNFYQDEVHLKQYAKRLREEVAATLEQQDVAYSAKFLVMENITVRPHPVDPPPVKVLSIEVYAKNISNKESGVEKCIYKGIFLSWRTIQNELTIANSVRLPLLLCRGTQSGMRTVHSIIGRMFDCMTIALPAHEDDLIWLAAIVITPTNREEQPKGTDEIRMQYKIPELPDTDTIAVKFQVLDLIRILTAIIKDQSDEASNEISFNLDHIEKFREVLYNQMLEIAGLQLGLCTLNKIQLPALTIMENKIKVTKLDTMNRVLLYLNEKALDTFHTLNFEV